MNRTRQTNDTPLGDRIAITTQDLQELLGCGRSSAVRIGEDAGAKIQIGKRVLWNVSKVKEYIDLISN